MIQIHAIKIQRLIADGASSGDIVKQFSQYTVEDINAFRPVVKTKPKTKSKAKAVSADVTG